MRILSWNVHWCCGRDGRVDFDRVAAAIIALARPEVLCLQEIAVNHPGLTGSSGEDQVAELARRLPGYSAHYAAASDLPDDAGGRRLFGNLILARLPVGQVFRHALPYPADPGCPNMPRVALEAVIGGALPLRVVTTHLEYFSLAQRLAQMHEIRRLEAEAAGHARAHRPDAGVDPPFRAVARPAAGVWCGDFNCPPEADELAALLGPDDSGRPPLLDAWPLAHAGAAAVPTVGLSGWEWPASAYRCDYFLVSPALADAVTGYEVVARPEIADHQPIVLELRADTAAA